MTWVEFFVDRYVMSLPFCSKIICIISVQIVDRTALWQDLQWYTKRPHKLIASTKLPEQTNASSYILHLSVPIVVPECTETKKVCVFSAFIPLGTFVFAPYVLWVLRHYRPKELVETSSRNLIFENFHRAN